MLISAGLSAVLAIAVASFLLSGDSAALPALPWIVTLVGALGVALTLSVAIARLRAAVQEREIVLATLERSNRSLERRLVERSANLREADEEIQRLANIVGNDVRTGLANIIGFTGEVEALRNNVMERAAVANRALNAFPEIEDANERALRQDFDEALWFIRSSVAKLDRLIAGIVDLAQISRRELKAEVVDLDRLMRALAADFSHRTDKGGIRLAVGKLPTVVGDRQAVEQILAALLDNAVKFLRDDQPGNIGVTGRETEDGTVEIAVADNGRGIAPEDHQRIFDLFRRAGAQDRPGDGVGLALVRALMRRVGGSIRVESRLGHGATFTVVLPKTQMP